MTSRTSSPLPVLLATDVLVIGGGFAGVAAACSAARQGKRVCLIEQRTFLGGEITSKLRPWMSVQHYRKLQNLFGWGGEAQPATELKTTVAGEDECPTAPEQLKLDLEDALLAAGVSLLYLVRPIGCTRDGNYIVEVAGKFGRKIIIAEYIVDTAEHGLLARCLTQSEARYSESVIKAWRSAEFTGVDQALVSDGQLGIPRELTACCRIHKGSSGSGHCIIEYEMELERKEGVFWINEEEVSARLATVEIARWLIGKHPAFAKATMTGSSHELRIPPLYRILSAGISADMFPTDAGLLPAGAFYCGNNVWAASGIGDVDNAIALGLGRHPLALAQLGHEIGKRVGKAGRDGKREGDSLAPQHRLAAEKRKVDVLVIGGGTSGAAAAITAAQRGCRTLLVEMNPELGGTGTIGGVDSYWFGRRAGFNKYISRWVAEEHQAMGLTWTGATAEKWNVPAKMTALLRAALYSGVEIQLNSTLVTVRKGLQGIVTGAIAATSGGLIEIEAGVTIDATGDGDAAAQAGAEFVYGADRDSVTMWYSLAPYARPGVTRNNFTSMVNVSDAGDYARAILSARRRYIGYDHSSYLAARESRHIVGEVRLTLTDHLTMRRWPDVVNIAFSNHDIKGHTSSDWIRMGLIPPNLEIEIPYRCLIPQGVDGLLVAGKAVSATHDSLPAIRMQADLENLGAVCGVAASICATKGIGPKDVPVRELQEALVQLDILPHSILTRSIQSSAPSVQDMREWIHAMDDAKPLYSYSDMGYLEVHAEPIPIVLVCTAGPAIVPFLYEELEQSQSPRRLSTARALAWYEDQAATPVLIEHIEPYLLEEELPPRTSKVRHANVPPDQGAMPDLAYLLHTLAMVRDERAIAIMERAEAKLNPTREKIADGRWGLFNYIDALCDIAERLGHPDCIPVLKRLHNHTLFNGKEMRGLMQPDFIEERQAMLELIIARALARCGDAYGIRILASYLGDSRKPLAEHAYSELKSITGARLDTNPETWHAWLAEAGALQPRPWIVPRG